MSLCEPNDPTDVAGRLNYACQLGHSSFVDAVVKECHVKNFDLLDQYGSPPLYNAALKNDCPRLIEYLLTRNATVAMKNADNETALFIAAFNNHIEVVRTLIAAGAKVDEKGGVYGDYPLHAAVKNNLQEMVQLLLANNASVNCRNDDNETPLYIACKFDREQLAYDLLMNKANKNLASEGKDCLYIASERRNKNIVKLLKASGTAELMELHKTLTAPAPAKKEKKKNWREAQFQQELGELGISEEQAGRKARHYPHGTRIAKKKKKPGQPTTLFDSDEDMEDQADRMIREQPHQPEPSQRYQDPEGTNFNPSDSAHVSDIVHAREAFKSYRPPSGPRPIPPKPGSCIDAATGEEEEQPLPKKVKSPQTKPLSTPQKGATAGTKKATSSAKKAPSAKTAATKRATGQPLAAGRKP